MVSCFLVCRPIPEVQKSSRIVASVNLKPLFQVAQEVKSQPEVFAECAAKISAPVSSEEQVNSDNFESETESIPWTKVGAKGKNVENNKQEAINVDDNAKKTAVLTPPKEAEVASTCSSASGVIEPRYVQYFLLYCQTLNAFKFLGKFSFTI